MQLLPSCPIAIPQFASLSFLLKPEVTSASSCITEPLLIASTASAISTTGCLCSLQELHTHLTASLNASKIKAAPLPENQQALIDIFTNDDQVSFEDVQIFRPLRGNGIALHYRLVRGDEALLLNMSNHIMASTNTSFKPTNNTSLPQGVAAVVLCVGVSGLSVAYGASPLDHSLPQRMSDCLALLAKIKDTTAVRTILSSFLLVEDECRKTEEMYQAPNVVVFSKADESEKAKGILSSPMAMISPMAGMMSPVAGMISPITNVARKSGKRSSRHDSGEMGPAHNESIMSLSLKQSSSDAARTMTERLNVLSVAETDTFLRHYTTPGQERKANLDLTGGGKSGRFRRKGSSIKDADFDNFDYKGPVREVIKKKTFLPSRKEEKEKHNAFSSSGSVSSQSKNDRRNRSTSSSSSVPALSASRSDKHASRRMNSHASDDSHTGRSSRRRNQSGKIHDDDVSLLSEGRSTTESVSSSSNRLQVNIALNEDLSCTFRSSQLASCSIEGVVQIQTKTNSRSQIPFFLLVRDPSGHVESLQENRKFVNDMSHSLIEGQDDDIDRKFAVSVPKGDNYFPVIKYKCVGELRPVPIRVQTRVKVDESYCRVALQISSNPNNEAGLDELTIIMGVPDEVKGDTLVTQPEGGVWNEAKRSVIWVVSELGTGEKFLLQARFEVEDHFDFRASEEPKFPVLVRCQCLFAQLSDVELEVMEMPGRHAAEVSMKLARRFRLSHRERS